MLHTPKHTHPYTHTIFVLSFMLLSFCTRKKKTKKKKQIQKLLETTPKGHSGIDIPWGSALKLKIILFQLSKTKDKNNNEMICTSSIIEKPQYIVNFMLRSILHT